MSLAFAAKRPVYPCFEPLEGKTFLSASASASTTVMAVAAQPSVSTVSPKNGAANVDPGSFIACDLKLVGAGIKATTLRGHVTLVRASDGASVDGNVNTSGGGDTIVFTPAKVLAGSTKYTFKISSGVKDTAGRSFKSFTSSFTTGKVDSSSSKIQFDKVKLSTSSHAYTAVAVGPDHRLYAADDQGDIFRFDIKSDGTLTNSKSIQTIRSSNGGARLITGMVFDPASTSSNLILWVSHGYASFINSPDLTGKISKLTGTDLKTSKDVVVNMPRAYKDHQTEQMVFGPDGALYISQASMSAMGASDPTWGNRSEHLLSAAILRLDVKKLGSAKLDVKTPDAGGKYNPFASGAPLTIYATGVRNAYDMVWTHDGHLFAPTNGSASGGNTPAGNAPFSGTRIDEAANGKYTSPAVPGLKSVGSQHDYLFDVQKNGYYGHPNPLRNEFVLNGGNPTSGSDKAQVSEYPVGTKPDRNYRGFAWDFGKFESPDGVIEYRGNAFGGALDGKLLVCQYSGGDNIVVLSRSGGKITGAAQGYSGLTGFIDPLDLAQDLTNGNIYVAEYGGKRITLLRPKSTTTAAPTLALAKPQASLFAIDPSSKPLTSGVL